MSDSNKFAGCFGKVVVTLLVAVLGTLAGGWVLSVIWGWFLVPVFDAPSLTIAQALGARIVGGLLFPQGANQSDSKGKDWLELVCEAAAKAIGAPLITLGLAWVIRGFL